MAKKSTTKYKKQMDWGSWGAFTITVACLYALASGAMLAYLPGNEVYFGGVVPFDPTLFLWILITSLFPLLLLNAIQAATQKGERGGQVPWVPYFGYVVLMAFLLALVSGSLYALYPDDVLYLGEVPVDPRMFFLVIAYSIIPVILSRLKKRAGGGR